MHHAEGRQDQDPHLPSKRRVESASLGLVSRPFSGAGMYGCPVSPPGTLMTEEFEEELNADAQQAKPLPIPAKPTPEMIAAHEGSTYLLEVGAVTV